MFTNGLSMVLPRQVRVKTHWLFSKENVLGTAVSKEGCANNLLGHDRTHHK